MFIITTDIEGVLREDFCNGGIINLLIGVEPEKERILFMLIKEKNVLIVSIDHGFCSIKGPHFVMENGVTRISTEPAFKENTIFYKGSYYKVGEGRLTDLMRLHDEAKQTLAKVDSRQKEIYKERYVRKRKCKTVEDFKEYQI